MYNHFLRLNEFYEVNLYKGFLDKVSRKLEMLPLLPDDVVIRIYPTEKDDDKKDKQGMAMLVTKNSLNDIKLDLTDVIEYIPSDIETS
jgi:hypothetical protein